jgi:hypothetical protein
MQQGAFCHACAHSTGYPFFAAGCQSIAFFISPTAQLAA